MFTLNGSYTWITIAVKEGMNNHIILFTMGVITYDGYRSFGRLMNWFFLASDTNMLIIKLILR